MLNLFVVAGRKNVGSILARINQRRNVKKEKTEIAETLPLSPVDQDEFDLPSSQVCCSNFSSSCLAFVYSGIICNSKFESPLYKSTDSCFRDCLFNETNFSGMKKRIASHKFIS